jgi:hypothetical protein
MYNRVVFQPLKGSIFKHEFFHPRHRQHRDCIDQGLDNDLVNFERGAFGVALGDMILFLQ